jgi:hypothetical protein
MRESESLVEFYLCWIAIGVWTMIHRASGDLLSVAAWRKLCPSCFDTEAEKAGVHYKFTDVEAMSWSDRPTPRAKRTR